MSEKNTKSNDVDSMSGSGTASKGNKKKLSHEQRLKNRYHEKVGRKNNRGSHKSQKSGTGRKSW